MYLVGRWRKTQVQNDRLFTFFRLFVSSTIEYIIIENASACDATFAEEFERGKIISNYCVYYTISFSGTNCVQECIGHIRNTPHDLLVVFVMSQQEEEVKKKQASKE